MIIEIIILAALGWLAIYVVGFLGYEALRRYPPQVQEPPSVDYADEFCSKLSGSDESPVSSSHGPSDPDIVFATATPSTRRRTGLAAAHAAPHSRKEATSTSYAFNEPTEHATTAAASPTHLYLVP